MEIVAYTVYSYIKQTHFKNLGEPISPRETL